MPKDRCETNRSGLRSLRQNTNNQTINLNKRRMEEQTEKVQVSQNELDLVQKLQTNYNTHIVTLKAKHEKKVKGLKEEIDGLKAHIQFLNQQLFLAKEPVGIDKWDDAVSLILRKLSGVSGIPQHQIAPVNGIPKDESTFNGRMRMIAAYYIMKYLNNYNATARKVGYKSHQSVFHALKKTMEFQSRPLLYANEKYIFDTVGAELSSSMQQYTNGEEMHQAEEGPIHD